MELIIVDTPSGYKAYLKPKLTYGEFKHYKRATMSGIEYDTTAKVKMSASAIVDMEEAGVKTFLVKLVDPQGKELENPTDAINNIDNADAEVVTTKINELVGTLSPDKKKLNS